MCVLFVILCIRILDSKKILKLWKLKNIIIRNFKIIINYKKSTVTKDEDEENRMSTELNKSFFPLVLMEFIGLRDL